MELIREHIEVDLRAGESTIASDEVIDAASDGGGVDVPVMDVGPGEGPAELDG